MINSDKWLDSLPNGKKNLEGEKNLTDPKIWINTLPNTNKPSSVKKYSLTAIVFVIGLLVVSAVKNKTRNLEKEIRNLSASISILESDLHQTILDHAVITSPENISKLAEEYLDSSFVTYKKNQITKLQKKEKILTNLENLNLQKTERIAKRTKLIVVKKIEEKKNELAKLQELYSEPKNLPNGIKMHLARKIETTKDELKYLYSNPTEIIKSDRVSKWAALQIVKVFLGIPVIPGK